MAREIDDEIRRIVEEAHQAARDILLKRRPELDHTSDILVRRETIEREQFIDLLAGKSEEDVFGPPEPVRPPAAEEPVEEPKRKPAEGPRPLPRPGLAAEMRADDDQPDKPSL